MVKGLVSIITPTYNRGYLIEKTIESVMSQSYANWEWLIVDDGSVDNTEQIVEKYIKKDARIRYIKNEKNQGANICRNLGASLATGEYFAFLDSDNIWNKNKLEIQIKEIKDSADEVGFVYSKEYVIDGARKWVVPSKAYAENELKNVLLEKNVIDTSTVLIKKECFERCEGFDVKIPRLQDWELFIRIVEIYAYKGVCINEILNTNIIQQDSISKDSKKYVDAIFYIICKYKNYLNKKNIVEMLVGMIIYAESFTEYIIKNIKENGYGSEEYIEAILESLIIRTQKEKRISDILYQWKIKNIQEALYPFVGKKVVIYGLGKWGELLFEDLKNVGITVEIGMDRDVDWFHDLTIKRSGEEIGDTDVIIVSVSNGADIIRNELKKRYNVEIYLLEDLIR